MKKTTIKYTVLSKKELTFLKDNYVKDKINGMSEKDLKNFVFDSINHQIKDTVGHEEESEAWKEMESFYNDKFEIIIKEIQEKFKAFSDPIEENIEEHKKRSKILETNKLESEKEDMWED